MFRAMLSSSSLQRRNVLSSLTQIKALLCINIQSFSTIPNPNPQLTPSSIGDTLTSYSNDWKRALDFFHWVETQYSFAHTTDTYNRTIDVLGKFFEFDLCWKLIHRMKNSPASAPNHETFRSMFDRYACAHMVNDAVEAYQKLDGFNLRDEVSYYNLIHALCQNKHVIEAQELWLSKDNRDRDLDLGIRVCDTKIHNMILRGWYKMGWWGRCREYWIEMDEKGVKKDLHSYSIYMDIVCRSGKPWRAVKLYKEMKSKRMKLDTAAYNTVIRAIGLSQGVDFSIRILKEMKELGCKPSIVTYNTILKLLCENGRFREARQLFDEMPIMGCEHNAITYHSFFATLEKPNEIMRLFDEMLRSGVSPRTDTFVMLMKKFGRWGYLRLVLCVWEKMGEVKCSPDADAYNALIDALLEKGMLDMGRKYEQEMCERGLSPKPRRGLFENVDELVA